MKVILKQEIANLGTIGDVVKVASGYARNYLIPQGRAVEATPENLRDLEHQMAALKKKRDARLGEAEEMAEKLGHAEISLSRKVVDEDRLYGSVTPKDIAEALEEMGFEVEKKAILLPEAIRTLGEFDVGIRLHPQVEVTVKLNVVEEK